MMMTSVLDRPTGLLTCPLCHRAFGAFVEETLAAGGGCQCGTCGQRWTATRLKTVAAYAQWVVARNRAIAAA
jgi:transcription elongation factor Elf1